jgi:hypothetical protein
MPLVFLLAPLPAQLNNPVEAYSADFRNGDQQLAEGAAGDHFSAMSESPADMNSMSPLQRFTKACTSPPRGGMWQAVSILQKFRGS